MKAPLIEKRTHQTNPVAKLNRRVLSEAGVFAVSVSGGPGCGKTSLIDTTRRRLMPEVRVGVIACDVTSHLDADRIVRDSDQVVRVNIGDRGISDATHIHDALELLDLDRIDLLFIENVGMLFGAVGLDLGQNATAAMFSVAGGHDKANKNPDLVRDAGIILLNKSDLLPSVPFDLTAFRADVLRLNLRADLIALSALRGDGMDAWLEWLMVRLKEAADRHRRVVGINLPACRTTIS